MIRKSEYEIQKDLKNLETDLDDLSTTVASKTEVNDDVSDSVDTTYSASKIEERLAEIPSGGVEEAPVDGKQYGRKDEGWTEITAGGHTQNTDTGTTGNTFTVDSDSTTGKIILDVALGAADLSLTLTNETLTSSSKIATLQNKTGTVALTSDIPVKASTAEVNAGTDDAKFVTSAAIYGSSYLDNVKATSLTDISDAEIDLDNHSLILIDTGDSTIKKITFANLKKYLDTLYTPL